MNSSLTRIAVGLGELAVSTDPGQVLVSHGLGSCVAVAMYDRVSRVAGMAHVVLPSSSLDRGGAGPGRFADTAVPALLDEMVRQGAHEWRLNVWLAGGANVLAGLGLGPGLDIGSRNIAALHAVLQNHRLALAGADVGGDRGRTVRLIVATGRIVISAVGKGDREI